MNKTAFVSPLSCLREDGHQRQSLRVIGEHQMGPPNHGPIETEPQANIKVTVFVKGDGL